MTRRQTNEVYLKLLACTDDYLVKEQLKDWWDAHVLQFGASYSMDRFYMEQVRTNLTDLQRHQNEKCSAKIGMEMLQHGGIGIDAENSNNYTYKTDYLVHALVYKKG